MIVEPRVICGRVYLEMKKKGWMFVANVSSHCSLFLVRLEYMFFFRRRTYSGNSAMVSRII